MRRSPVPIILALFGFGALVLAANGSGTRTSHDDRATALRDRVIEAQRASARASQRARDLCEQWSALEAQQS